MTRPALTVRRATPDDFADVSRLTVEAYFADGQLDEEKAYAATLADVPSRAAGGEILVAADEAGRLLGAVLFVLPGSRFAELAKDGEAEFRMLAVDPSAQRRGVARTLVQACVDRATRLGCEALVICTRTGNTAALALYDAFGFERDPALDWTPVPGVDLLGLRLKL